MNYSCFSRQGLKGFATWISKGDQAQCRGPLRFICVWIIDDPSFILTFLSSAFDEAPNCIWTRSLLNSQTLKLITIAKSFSVSNKTKKRKESFESFENLQKTQKKTQFILMTETQCKHNKKGNTSWNLVSVRTAVPQSSYNRLLLIIIIITLF